MIIAAHDDPIRNPLNTYTTGHRVRAKPSAAPNNPTVEIVVRTADDQRRHHRKALVRRGVWITGVTCAVTIPWVNDFIDTVLQASRQLLFS